MCEAGNLRMGEEVLMTKDDYEKVVRFAPLHSRFRELAEYEVALRRFLIVMWVFLCVWVAVVMFALFAYETPNVPPMFVAAIFPAAAGIWCAMSAMSKKGIELECIGLAYAHLRAHSFLSGVSVVPWYSHLNERDPARLDTLKGLMSMGPAMCPDMIREMLVDCACVVMHSEDTKRVEVAAEARDCFKELFDAFKRVQPHVYRSYSELYDRARDILEKLKIVDGSSRENQPKASLAS